jgi:hypothetical protein
LQLWAKLGICVDKGKNMKKIDHISFVAKNIDNI